MSKRNTVCGALAALVLCAGAATAQEDDLAPLPHIEPRSSIKVERITPEMMINVCAEQGKDEVVFLDSEYDRAMREIRGRARNAAGNATEVERLNGLVTWLKECKENNRNIRYAQRSKRSCKALLKNHKAAADSAWSAVAEGWPDKYFLEDMNNWRERFREPLEKCLREMPCRMDNRQDMEMAAQLYRQFTYDWFGPATFEKMKICGVTVRNLQYWCRSAPEGNTTTNICVDAGTMANALANARQVPILNTDAPADEGAFDREGAP